MKGSKITPEDAAKNPQAVLEALEFYTEQTRREKNNDTYDKGQQETREEDKNMSNPKPSRSTPAPRHIREPPRRPSQQQKQPALPKADLNLVKGMDKDVQIMMEKLKIQQEQQQVKENDARE